MVEVGVKLLIPRVVIADLHRLHWIANGLVISNQTSLLLDHLACMLAIDKHDKEHCEEAEEHR